MNKDEDNMICNECETVAHCTEHGCVPKQPAPVREDWGPGPHEVHSLPPAAPVQSCYCLNCEAMGKELAALKAQPAPVQPVVTDELTILWVLINAWRDAPAPALHICGKINSYVLALKHTTPPAQPAPVPLTDGVLKITMQINGFEVSRLLSLDVIRTSNVPEVERHSRQAWLDLQKAAHGITEKGQP